MGKRIWAVVKPLLRGILPPPRYEALRRWLLCRLARFGYTNAQHRMDRRIAALFGGKRGGVFVEAGAADGVDQSNTLYLERVLGWRGLLVEPVRAQFEQCRRTRPDAIVERYVLCPFARRGETMTVLADGLTSIVRESRWHAPAGGGRPARDTGGESAVAKEAVPGIALTELLERHGMREVDIISLDVEGAELFVLDGLDFDRIRVAYLLVETADAAAVSDYLAGRFTLAAQWSDGDYLFRNAAL